MVRNLLNLKLPISIISVLFNNNFKNLKIMAVLKVVEILSNSDKSWEDATKKAVKEASKTVKNIKSVYVKEQSAIVNGDNVTEFRVNLKLTFEVK